MGKKITLDIGMRADTSACDKAVAAVESLQGATKNANRVLVASMRSMSQAIGGNLGLEISQTAGAISELGKSGLWGLVAFAINRIGDVFIRKFMEMKEAARRFAEYCQTGLTRAIETAAKKYNDFQVVQGREKMLAASASGMKEAKIEGTAKEDEWTAHLVALAKITDETTASEKEVILADEALAVAKIREKAAAEKSAIRLEGAGAEVSRAAAKRAEAEKMLAETTNARAQLEARYGNDGDKWYSRLMRAQELLAWNDERLAQKTITLSDYYDFKKKNQMAIAKIEEEHKGELDRLNAAKKSEAEAAKAVADASAAEKVATDALAKVKLAVRNAEIDAATVRKNAEKRLADANEAAAKAAAVTAADKELEEAKRRRAQAELDAAEATRRLDGLQTAPKVGAAVVTPKVGEAVVTPKVGAAVVTPKVGAAVVTPKVGAAVVTPKVGAAVVTPKVGAAVVTTKVGAAVVTPKVGAAVVTPKVIQPVVRPVVKNVPAEDSALRAAKAAESEAAIRLAKAKIEEANAIARRRALGTGEEAATVDLAAAGKDLAKIYRVAEQNQVKATDYVNLYIQSLAVGRSRAEAFAAMQTRLTAELGARAQEERASRGKIRAAEEAVAASARALASAQAERTRIVSLKDIAQQGRELDPGHKFKLDRNGDIITAHDWARAKKAVADQRGREERGRRGAERIAEREDAEAARILKKSRKGFRLLDSEKRKLETWQEARQQRADREAAEKRVRDAERDLREKEAKLQRERDARAKKMAEDVAGILGEIKAGITP